MKRHRPVACLALALVVLLAVVGPSAADSTASVSWYVIASGGGQSQSTNYTLGGTVGQAGAGVAYSQNYRLVSGFWYVTGMPEVMERLLFLPTVLKTYR